MTLRILRGAARSRHVFKREFILLVDRTNMLFSQPSDGFRLQNSLAIEDYHWRMQSSVANFQNRNVARAYGPSRRKNNSLPPFVASNRQFYSGGTAPARCVM